MKYFLLSSLGSVAIQLFAQTLAVPALAAHTPHPAAETSILYELQVRSANACRTDLGTAWQRAACASKVAPSVRYRAFEGDSTRCAEWGELRKIRLGTLDDLLESSSDYEAGITLRYIQEKVGADTLWLMPLFPNNDRWNIPDACDNLGSPYAVRDYFHASGMLDRACIRLGRDEYSAEEGGSQPCWGNLALDKVIAEAHRRGMKVMLDVAFNHFGHNYVFYDSAQHISVRERMDRGTPLDDLWDFDRTFEPGLVRPEIIDTEAKLLSEARRDPGLGVALSEMRAKCPAFRGDELVRATLMWREMLDWERAQFSCEQPLYLEYAAPGFYAGRQDGWEPRPSSRVGDNFTNNWVDVKFLYHHERRGRDSRGDFYAVFVRNREYLFRVLNYWASRGADGFRLDHTTDSDSGLAPNEWKYLIEKVSHYDWIRKGRPSNYRRPLFLAEEFHDQMGMKEVVDTLTEGYVGDIRGRNGEIKDASFVEEQLGKEARFEGRALIMRALETHDETRLFDRTGFDLWTGAGFWGIGAASHGTPMLLMGQEFGESWGLGFRKSALLASRFEGHPNFRPEGAELASFYRAMILARRDPRNRALSSPDRYFLRSRHTGRPDPRIFAQVKWSSDGEPRSVLFAFHNLWYMPEAWLEQSYAIPADIASRLGIRDQSRYQLVNVLDGKVVGSCRAGAELSSDFYVRLNRVERLQWLRLEPCPNWLL